jgi:hypothetical protein
LKELYPRAFAAASDKDATVSRVWSYSSSNWNLIDEDSSKRATRLWEERRRLISNLESFRPRPGVEDKYLWEGTYSLQSGYNRMLSLECGWRCDFIDKKIWLLKIPLKVQIFLWLCRRDGLITSDLRHRRLGTDHHVYFLCEMDIDNVNHLLSSCLVTDDIWRKTCQEPLPEWDSIWHGFEVRGKPHVHMAATIWCVWKARNERLFQERPVCCESIVRECWSLIHSWGSFL